MYRHFLTGLPWPVPNVLLLPGTSSYTSSNTSVPSTWGLSTAACPVHACAGVDGVNGVDGEEGADGVAGGGVVLW